jgi:hypothetical protein
MGSRSTARSIVTLPFLALIGFTASFMPTGGMKAVAGDARLKTFTCSGQLWNVSTDSAGTTWLEIGHGTSQCSIKNASSENAKKILSICNLNADCSMKVAVDVQRFQKSIAEGECDDLCIFEGDKIVWVKKGRHDNRQQENR